MPESDLSLEEELVAEAQRRLLDSVPDELDASDEPEPAEREIRDALEAEGWEVLGGGMGRVGAVPPTDNVVVKLSRPRPDIREDSLSGPSQNTAERQVWKRVAGEGVPDVEADWFAPVHATGDIDLYGVTYEDAWLAMKRLVPITALDRDDEWIEAATTAVKARFTDCVIHPDIDPSNIGIRSPGLAPEAPRPEDPFVVIDYGVPNWTVEGGLP